MERLINHLQDTLDEDEAAKDALLLLRNKENNCRVSESVDPWEHINDRFTKLLIFESIVAKIMDRCKTSIDLPLFIVSMKLELSVYILRTICDKQTLYTTWSANFIQCINQVISIFETAVLQNIYVPNAVQIIKLAEFKEKIKEIQSEGCETGTVISIKPSHIYVTFISIYTDSIETQFALDAIVEEVLARASALRLETLLPSAESGPEPLRTLEVDVASLTSDQPLWIDRQNAVVVLAPLILQPRASKHL